MLPDAALCLVGGDHGGSRSNGVPVWVASAGARIRLGQVEALRDRTGRSCEAFGVPGPHNPSILAWNTAAERVEIRSGPTGDGPAPGGQRAGPGAPLQPHRLGAHAPGPVGLEQRDAERQVLDR